jgi:hypothetical protein
MTIATIMAMVGALKIVMTVTATADGGEKMTKSA